MADANEQAAIECRNALFLTDPHVDRESLISAKGTRVAGTCGWITHNESYHTWLHGDDDDDDDSGNNDNTRLLWISGGPGKGKTMLSIFLTEELERHAAGLENAELAFLFCSAQDKKRNTAVAVLRGLVHQIISKRPKLVKHALPYFETPERTQQSLWSLETLWIIFSKLVADAGLGKMFCVLDGLDECEDSRLRVLLPRIVGLLASTTPSRTRGNFKLAIVSRDIPGLQGCTRIRLDPDNDEKVVSDIELFVSARVGELSRIEGFNDKFRASVQTALLQRAGGTFLWVGFTMHELSQKQTCSEILEALEELPSGLPAVYGRMMLQIPARHRDMSRAILSWVTLAVRPLQLGELAAAVGLLAPSSLVTLEQATRDAITHCGPLLEIQEQGVSLVHQSARDYLLRRGRDSDGVLETFRFDKQSAHLQLARQCLDCIAQSDLQYKAIGPAAKQDTQESSLLRYAVLYWPEHARSCSALAANLLDPHGLFLKKKSSLRIHWWEAYTEMANVQWWKTLVQCGIVNVNRRECPPLLHIACLLGIIPWIEAILAKSGWRPRCRRRVNKKDALDETALHLAIEQGNEAVVQLLLDRGADLEAKNRSGDTALQIAFGNKDEEIVRLLVDKGADLEARGWQSKGTVLHLAAEEGDEVLVQLLIEREAEIKAKGEDGKTALHFAACGGSKAVVRLLLERGMDMNTKDKTGETSLHSAIWEENEAVARLLIEGGADLKAKTNYGTTALHFAARQGNKAIVSLLVEKGADVNARDMIGRTALGYGTLWESGNEAVVQ